MKRAISRWLNAVWYQGDKTGFWLIPLSWVYRTVVSLRRLLYQYRLIKIEPFAIPIIVVGNISVGGTGKTPLLIWLAQYLQQQGYHPGIISRGYGGQAQQWPQWVDKDSDARLVGDEALVIVAQTGCPMTVGPVRTDNVKMLQQSQCDIILSDDGLQHYALVRDIEIAVIDGQRRFGNGHCLPAGPLREPVSRLRQVDLIIVNGSAPTGEYGMDMIGDTAINLKTGEQKPLLEFSQNGCHAMAGIGNPQRFFEHLIKQGLHFDSHIFPDHHRYQQQDIDFTDAAAVLMTEKDAVKCTAFAKQQHWYVPVKAQPDSGFAEQLLAKLKEINHG